MPSEDTSIQPLDGIRGAQHLQLHVIQQEAAVLQRRIDKQLHVNSTLKGCIAGVQEEVCIIGQAHGICSQLYLRETLHRVVYAT